MKQKRGSKKCLPWATPGSRGSWTERKSKKDRQNKKGGTKKKKGPWSGSCGKASTSGMWSPQPRPAGRWCMCREAGRVLSLLFSMPNTIARMYPVLCHLDLFSIGRAWPPWTKAKRWAVWTKCFPSCSPRIFHWLTGAGAPKEEDRNKSEEGQLDSVQLWFCQFLLHGILTCFLQLCVFPSFGLPARIQQQHLRP